MQKKMRSFKRRQAQTRIKTADDPRDFNMDVQLFDHVFK